MWDASHDKLVGQAVKAVQILKYQPHIPHQLRLLEILRKRRVELCDKERIVGRQCRYERGIDSEIVVLTVTCSASSAVALESFIKEDLPPGGHERADLR